MRIAVGVLLASIASPAFAVDFSKPIPDDEGRPLCEDQLKPGETCPADKVFTLSKAARTALLANISIDGKELTGEQKAERGDLARNIRSATPGNFKLKLEDRALIKGLIGKVYGPAIVSPAWKMLEEEDAK